MKFFEGSSEFNYSWAEMSKAMWQRYPNPYSTHVLSEDTIEREMRGNKLYSKRLLTKTNPVPKWGERLMPAKVVTIVEESIVDPDSKELCTYTRNIGQTKLMTCVEKVTYRPKPTNPLQTVAERQVWFESKIFGFSYAIQKFGLERYKKNVLKTDKGLNFVLNRLFPVESHDTTIEHRITLEETKLRLKEALETAKLAKDKTKMNL